MMNLGNPDQAFGLSLIPNDGVGLARMEFIINDLHQDPPDGTGASREGRRPIRGAYDPGS